MIYDNDNGNGNNNDNDNNKNNNVFSSPPLTSRVRRKTDRRRLVKVLLQTRINKCNTKYPQKNQPLPPDFSGERGLCLERDSNSHDCHQPEDFEDGYPRHTGVSRAIKK